MVGPFSTATELAAAIRNKQVSSLELTDMYIDRVERYDAKTNAVVVHDFERGREAAKAADEALARGERTGRLHGVPMTVKEAYDTQGLPTTWGVPELHGNIAAADADYVRRLKQAGAVLFGKTNVPFNLADFQSFNEIYGTTSTTSPRTTSSRCSGPGSSPSPTCRAPSSRPGCRATVCPSDCKRSARNSTTTRRSSSRA